MSDDDLRVDADDLEERGQLASANVLRREADSMPLGLTYASNEELPDFYGLMDAYHVPAIICVSGEKLHPGEKVRFVRAGEVRGSYLHEEPDGVVDPFLPGDVDSGDYFWVLISPGRLLGRMRHHFSLQGIPVVTQNTFGIDDDEEEDDLDMSPHERWCEEEGC